MSYPASDPSLDVPQRERRYADGTTRGAPDHVARRCLRYREWIEFQCLKWLAMSGAVIGRLHVAKAKSALN